MILQRLATSVTTTMAHPAQYQSASYPNPLDPRPYSDRGMDNLAPELHDVHIIRNSELGSGVLGTVVRAWWQGATVAVKRVRVAFSLVESNDKLVDGMVSKLRKEAKLLCELRHPHIVQFFGLTRDDGLVMELLDMSLATRLHGERNSPPLTTQQQVEIMFGASAGVQYLHSKDILHRDLSSNNILLLELSDQRLVAKVTDYGTAVHIDPNRVLTHQTGSHGSLPYLAPEVLQSSSRRGESMSRETCKSDVWSLGILAMEVALALPPQVLRPEARTHDLRQLRGQRHVFITFVPDCLNEFNPQTRPEAQEVNMKLRALRDVKEREVIERQLFAAQSDGRTSSPSSDVGENRPVPCTDAYVDMNGREPVSTTSGARPMAVEFPNWSRTSSHASTTLSFSRSPSNSLQSTLSPTGQSAIPEDVLQDIAEGFSDYWQCERLAVSLQLQKGSTYVRQLQAQTMPANEIAHRVLLQWAMEKRSHATGEVLYNTLCGRLQLRSVANRVADRLLGHTPVDEIDGLSPMQQLPWQPRAADVSVVLKEDLLERIANEFHASVKCRRLAIYLGVGAGFVERLNSAGHNDPSAVAFRVLQKFMEMTGGGRDSARSLYHVLDDSSKLGMRRTASKFESYLLV